MRSDVAGSRDATGSSARGFGVVLVDDATGTCSDEQQDAFITMFLRLWGRVMPTDAVITEMSGNARQASAG